MPYPKAKIYKQGGHFIAIPHTEQPHKERRKAVETEIFVEDPPDETSATTVEIAPLSVEESKASETKSNPQIELTESKPQAEMPKPKRGRITTKRKLFDELYQTYYSEKKRTRRKLILQAMLPYFKTTKEVERFVKLVDGKCKTMLLVETPEAVEIIDEILNIDGINECHIGLNDLSLGYGMNFMFELLADGTVERLCSKFHEKGIKYGFGGIASIGRGLLPAENIIIEHYRLGSSMTILSRSFCDVNKFQNTADLYQIFNEGVTKIRKFEKEVLEGMYSFKDNYHEILNKIRAINR